MQAAVWDIFRSVQTEISQQLLEKNALKVGIDIHDPQKMYTNGFVDLLTFPPAKIRRLAFAIFERNISVFIWLKNGGVISEAFSRGSKIRVIFSINNITRL